MHGCRVGGRSGLLADELHWPTTPSLTPALRFGSAVDGWRSFVEWIFSLRGIPKKCDTRQVGAVTEGELPDAGDAIRNRDIFQVGAVSEGYISDADDGIRNRDIFQAGAVSEGPVSDAGDAITNRDFRQTAALPEGAISKAGNTIAKLDSLQVFTAEE